MDSASRDSKSCGWMIKLCVHPSPEAVASALARAILATFEAPSSARPRALMLAGGRTPKAAYEQVAASGRRLPDDLSLIIGDERYVPADHADSNARMMQPFLHAVQCPPDRLIKPDTALPREACAEDFGRRLDRFLARGVVTTCFLGLGADGHTAGLFSASDLARANNRSAISVDRPDGKPGITATPSVIRRAERIVFVVTGADKREKVRQLLRQPMDIVAGRVVDRHPDVEVWVDPSARPDFAESP